MTSRAQALLQQALTLPADERADVAAELSASLRDREAYPAGATSSWGTYLDEGPFASKEFMLAVEDLPNQDR